MNRCTHNHPGTSVWQCDCYETGNVWILQRGDKRASKKPKGQKRDQLPVPQLNQIKGTNGTNSIQRGGSSQNLQYMQPEVAPKGILGCSDASRAWPKQAMLPQETGSRNNVFPGNEPKKIFQEKMISSPQGQFGLATPVKDPYLISGSELAIPEAMPKGTGPQISHVHSSSRDQLSVEKPPDQTVAKKPLRSSLKTPSDSLRKFRKKHVTQKVVTSVDKKKDKVKDGVMVTSL